MGIQNEIHTAKKTTVVLSSQLHVAQDTLERTTRALDKEKRKVIYIIKELAISNNNTSF